VYREQVVIPEPSGDDLRWLTAQATWDAVSGELTASTQPADHTSNTPPPAYGYEGLSDSRKRSARLLHHPAEPEEAASDSQKRLLRARINDFEKRVFVADQTK
jgi:hypothetical protein